MGTTFDHTVSTKLTRKSKIIETNSDNYKQQMKRIITAGVIGNTRYFTYIIFRIDLSWDKINDANISIFSIIPSD